MPERSDAYQLPSWPKTLIDRPLWNATMADIHGRLTAREELEASFESLKAQGIQASLDYIQVNVAPQIANLQQSITLAQDQIDQIIIGGKAPDTLKFGGQLPAFYATAQALTEGLSGKVPNERRVNGKELSADISLAKGDIGLGNADNTSDADKPISAQQAEAFAKRVRVDGAQEFSDTEKARARDNIAAQRQGALLDLLRGLQPAGNKLPYLTAADGAALTNITSLARALLDRSTGADMFSTMGGNQALGGSGWVRLPNGLIIQWGGVTTPGGNAARSLPMTFPNNAFAIVTTCQNPPPDNATAYYCWADNLSVGSFNARGRYIINGGQVGAADLVLTFVAFGN